MLPFNPGRFTNVAALMGSTGALALLNGEADGLAIEGVIDGVQLAIKDTATPANARVNIDINDATSPVVNSGTSPKLVLWSDGLYRWTAHNLFLNSAAPATQNVTLITGATYTVTVTGAGGGSITGSSGASGVATTGSPATFVATGTTGTFTYAGSLATIQLNRGSVATPYMATTAAQKFAVPTEYDPVTGKFALLVEPAATNLALYASDFTNAAWDKTGGGGITAAKTATGPDGVANSASTLTANGANGTALQSITSASAARISSVFVKRRTGTGNIDVTQDGGTTWTTVAVTAGWTKVNIPSATVTNPVVGFRIVTAADAIDVAWFVHELGTVATSPIPTFAATVTRAADQVNVAPSTFPAFQTAGTVIAEITQYAIAYGQYIVGETSSSVEIYNVASSYNSFDGTSDVQLSATVPLANTRYKIVNAFGGASRIGSVNGSAANPTAFDGSFTGTPLGLGYNVTSGGSQMNGRFHSLTILPRQLSAAEVVAKSTL